MLLTKINKITNEDIFIILYTIIDDYNFVLFEKILKLINLNDNDESKIIEHIISKRNELSEDILLEKIYLLF
jgi:hypothetical protein